MCSRYAFEVLKDSAAVLENKEVKPKNCQERVSNYAISVLHFIRIRVSVDHQLVYDTCYLCPLGLFGSLQ